MSRPIMDFEFSPTEITAIERVAILEVGDIDYADMRTNIHYMIEELAKIKGIDISDLDLEDETWC